MYAPAKFGLEYTVEIGFNDISLPKFSNKLKLIVTLCHHSVKETDSEQRCWLYVQGHHSEG